MGEIEGESEAEKRGDEKEEAPAREGEQSDCQVPYDAYGRNGNVLDYGVGTVVHDAAIPSFVDGTRLGACVVVAWLQD